MVLLMSLLSSCGKPQGVTVNVQAPSIVKKGEKFKIVAKALNTSAEAQTLVDLDIQKSYLDGILIEKTIPS